MRTHTHRGRPHLIMQSVSCGGPSSGAGRPHACYEYEWNYVWAIPHDMSHSSTSWNYAQHGQHPAHTRHCKHRRLLPPLCHYCRHAWLRRDVNWVCGNQGSRLLRGLHPPRLTVHVHRCILQLPFCFSFWDVFTHLLLTGCAGGVVEPLDNPLSCSGIV